MKTQRAVNWATVGLWACMVFSTSAQSLTWLGTLGGVRSDVYAVSADGCTVVGSSRDARGITRAFYWTHTGGMHPVETFPTTTYSEARGVSADGSVIVGWVNQGQGDRAFRWIREEGMQFLTEATSRAYGVSANGNAVTGWAQLQGSQAFRWTTEAGLQPIGGGNIQAWAISADGRTVVGRVSLGGGYQAFRWNEAYGVQPLGVPINGLQSYAYAVSADGRVVVGAWSPMGVTRVRAFRWSEGQGLHLITPDDEWLSDARSVTADGNLVAGIAAYYAHGRAFRWSPETGVEDMNVQFAYLMPEGSHLVNAYAISPDGRYLAGVGHNWRTLRYEAYLLDTWRYGDTNGDARIDDADLLSVLFAFGTAGIGIAHHEDIDKNGVVDDTDLLIVLLGYDF